MDIEEILHRIVERYPGSELEHQRRDVPRIAFHLSLVATRIAKNGSVADIGGSFGLFSPGAAALGFESILIDDFGGFGKLAVAADVFKCVHGPLGVKVVVRDVISKGVELEPDTLDAVTTFDSMEHWHHSPKRLLHELVTALKPGGLLVIGVPNCVNLRKRITVPLGIGKWSQMSDWYERDVFRGHVREPDVDDLRYIARDLGLKDCRIIGRNWLGYQSQFAWVRALTPAIDKPLRLLPSLCADLYLIGRKPE